MTKWKLLFCNEVEAREYLESGWEPFAVTCNPNIALGAKTSFIHTIWLRKINKY